MKTIYNGRKTLVDPKTGEEYHVANVVKIIDPANFVKIHLMDFLMSLGLFGGKEERVYLFVLQHLSYRTNKLKMTNEQIKKRMAKEGHKVSIATIKRALSKLEGTVDSKGNALIKRKRYGRYGRHSYIMLDPQLALVGKEKKRDDLFIQYGKANNKSKHKSTKAGRKRTFKARTTRTMNRQNTKARKQMKEHSSHQKININGKNKKASSN